jgi:uncharacterized repeat protein (TIGR03803 family)
MSHLRGRAISLLVVSVPFLAFSLRTHAQISETVLYTFANDSEHGRPTVPLVADSKGNLYGADCCNIFELSPPAGGSGAWTETALYHVASKGSLILDEQGNLYGTSYAGNGYGSVFELSPPASGSTGWTATVLYSFSGGADGKHPFAGLVFDSAGNLYGTTEQGGDGYGVVFELSPTTGGGWSETVLYTFTGAADGREPQYGSLVFDSAGNLYGTTTYGGAYSEGVAFELSPPAGGSGVWTETVLHAFGSSSGDGAYPAGVILGPGGNLYGTTSGGGTASSGTVFELSLSPPAEQVLLAFNGADGVNPYWPLAFDAAGNLYGVSSGGDPGAGAGLVFELSPPASGSSSWTEMVLYGFTGGSDGGGPAAGVIRDASGNLYGTTDAGGGNGAGVVYELAVSGSSAIITLASSMNPSIYLDSVTFTAEITPNPGAVGTVTFTQTNSVTTTTLCAAVPVNASGIATCATTALLQGDVAISATYSATGKQSILFQVVTPNQLMVNGGFETGSLSWWTASTGGCSPIVSKYKPHTGAYSAAEGATAHSTCPAGSAWLKQTVTIPSYATAATLVLWYWPKTDNTSASTNYLAVALRSASGVNLQNLLIATSDSQTWTTKSFNLNAYIGQTIVIYVPYYNNGSTHGGVYLDDFSLNLE